MLTNAIYPFVAVVGQEQLKKALQIALVNQKAGGLLLAVKKGLLNPPWYALLKRLLAHRR